MGPPMAHAGESARRRATPLAQLGELEMLELGIESTFLSEESDKRNSGRERPRRTSVSAVPSGSINLSERKLPVYPKSKDVANSLRSVLENLFIFQEVTL